MGATPTIRYHINIEAKEAWAKNELFPDQRVDLEPSRINGLKLIEIEQILRDEYKAKYIDRWDEVS